jgi:multicomponent Na+:H+ antiporter subunit F
VVAWAIQLSLFLLAAGLLLALVRLVKGPTLPDRVVALDLMASHAVAILVVHALAYDERGLLHPALVLALVAFLGTVAFARYIEKGGSR